MHTIYKIKNLSAERLQQQINENPQERDRFLSEKFEKIRPIIHLLLQATRKGLALIYAGSDMEAFIRYGESAPYQDALMKEQGSLEEEIESTIRQLSTCRGVSSTAFISIEKLFKGLLEVQFTEFKERFIERYSEDMFALSEMNVLFQLLQRVIEIKKRMLDPECSDTEKAALKVELRLQLLESEL